MAKKVKKQMSVEEFDKLTLGGFHTLPYGVTEDSKSKYVDLDKLDLIKFLSDDAYMKKQIKKKHTEIKYIVKTLSEMNIPLAISIVKKIKRFNAKLVK